jgi:hypothetical protein
MARVGEEFPLECPECGGGIRLSAFITDPGPIRAACRGGAPMYSATPRVPA